MSVAQLSKRDLILFDLDGTLVDSAADLYRSMNLSLQSLSCIGNRSTNTGMGR